MEILAFLFVLEPYFNIPAFSFYCKMLSSLKIFSTVTYLNGKKTKICAHLIGYERVNK